MAVAVAAASQWQWQWVHSGGGSDIVVKLRKWKVRRCAAPTETNGPTLTWLCCHAGGRICGAKMEPILPESEPTLRIKSGLHSSQTEPVRTSVESQRTDGRDRFGRRATEVSRATK